jgi:hypothetical protein
MNRQFTGVTEFSSSTRSTLVADDLDDRGLVAVTPQRLAHSVGLRRSPP